VATFADLLGPDSEPEFARSPLAFLAVSYEPGARPGADGKDGVGPGTEARVRAAAAMITDQCPRSVGGGTYVWLNGPVADVPSGSGCGFAALLSRLPEDGPLAAELGRAFACARSQPLDVGTAAGRLLRGMTPPFAVVTCTGPHQPVFAATDLMGCRHLYWYQGDRWAGVSTSLLALARCAGAAPDWEALAIRSTLGFHLGTSSPFAEIRKLGPGGACALEGGRVGISQYSDPRPEPSAAAHSSAGLVRPLVRFLREQGERYADLKPVIELSGGLDSRVLLASIPETRRSGLRAVTLNQPGAKDGQIARQLAAATGLDHCLVPMTEIGDLTPAGAWALVRAAAARDDCSSNPVSHAVLDWAEEHIGTDPRIHGAGGEIARGFYYLGQRQHARATPALSARLARWRLMTNEAVDAACLGNGLARWGRATTARAVEEVLSGYGCDWLRSTDEFYTWERVVRWAGLRLSASSTERTVLSPLLAPEFVAVARACPPTLKRNSRFMAMILSELDPDLARMPLDTGYIPARLAAPAVLARARSYPVTGKKVVRKVGQRIARRGRPGVGAPVLNRLVVEHWRQEPGVLAGVAATGLADDAWIGRMLAGACEPDPATVGYLANLVVMTEAVAVAPALAGVSLSRP
jgi:asparagine synthase (glutamine-hydrolysing)